MIKIKTIENRIPNVTRLITTTILNTKVTSIENKISDTTTFITTPKFNRLIKTNFWCKNKRSSQNSSTSISSRQSSDIADKNK